MEICRKIDIHAHAIPFAQYEFIKGIAHQSGSDSTETFERDISFWKYQRKYIVFDMLVVPNIY